MTYTTQTSWGGTEVRCEPGERENPVDCTRHSSHYFCRTCEGYYGVPHDGIHSGDDAHPNRFYQDCACRMCVNKRADLAKDGPQRLRSNTCLNTSAG